MEIGRFWVKVYRQVETQTVDRVAQTIDNRIKGLPSGSGFEKQYRQLVLHQHRHVDLKDQRVRGESVPDLADVYVDVTLDPRSVHAVAREPLASAPVPSTTARQSIWDFLATPQGAALAIIGAPGTGKTTLLKHLATELAQPVPGRPRRRDLPVMLLLRDRAADIVARPRTTLPEGIRDSLHSDLRRNEPEGWFDRQLADGRCTVLLDGLDEVADDSERQAVARWVESQIEAYPGNDFVITSRPQGYLSAQLNRPLILHVRRFTGEQIADFVRSWYGALRGSEFTAAARAKDAEDLLAQLRSKPMLYELATNPLLLTMIANVHLHLDRLPDSRAELYREICDVLLWRRHQTKHASGDAARRLGRQHERVLAELAFQMMLRKVRDVGLGQATEILQRALRQAGGSVTCEDFLASITATGLLIERERGEYAFAHLTIQEYLAAVHIQRNAYTTRLTQYIEDDWWRETSLLHAADPDSDPSPIIAACLDSGTLNALTLAFDMEQTAARRLPVPILRRLDEVRTEALSDPPSSPRRRLMTAATLARQLQDTVGSENGAVLCAKPLSHEAYRLFLDERGEQPGQAVVSREDGTAVGIPPHHVMDLVSWINGLRPDGPQWRPLSAHETQEAAFSLVSHRAADTVWCLDQQLQRLQRLRPWQPDWSPDPWVPRLDPPAEPSGTEGLDLLAFRYLTWLKKNLTEERIRHGFLSADHVSGLIENLRAYERVSPNVRREMERAIDIGERLLPSLAQDGGQARQPIVAFRAWPVGRGQDTDRLTLALTAAVSESRRRLGVPDDGTGLRRAYVRLSTRAIRDAAMRPVYPGDMYASLPHAWDRTIVATPEPPGPHDFLVEETRLIQELCPNTSAIASLDSEQLLSLGLAALTVASAAEEVGFLGLPHAAADYRTVAAGAVVLLQRLDDGIEPSEMIVLARA
ncbi:hypothetical protein TN53_23905 [Streptomyces sp. WM6386]|nr:hypothetical protein TN53_23905 [Streptomyces sp. WM6386]